MPAAALAAFFLVNTTAGARSSGVSVVPGDDLVSQIDRYRATTWRWRSRALGAHRRAVKPPHYGTWLCIHRYEGAWTDGGGPYYGGLQMDIGFQIRYGHGLFARKGTADHWTPLEQIWTAERALQAGRGFWPWPNTARACGVM